MNQLIQQACILIGRITTFKCKILLTTTVKTIMMDFQLVVFFSPQLCFKTKKFKYNTVELKVYRTKTQQSGKFIFNGKASAYNAADLGSIPGLGRSPREGNGNPFQYSCLENLTDGGAKGRTRLSSFTICIILLTLGRSFYLYFLYFKIYDCKHF